MRVFLAAALLLLCVGCVSEETRDLAWGMAQYQKVQVTSVQEVVTKAVGANLISAEDAKSIVDEQKALADAANTLVEILGAPETTPELPGISEVPNE